MQLTEGRIQTPSGLAFRTSEAVIKFAEALARKLHDAEIKYGYTDGWTFPDWEAKCRKELYEHAAKGDPRDVAIYAMFMWHHGWSTKLEK